MNINLKNKAFSLQALLSVSLAFPLATQEDVAAEIAKVADLEETEFAAEPRDAKVKQENLGKQNEY